MENTIRFTKPTDIGEVIKYNKGIKPRFADKSSVERGTARCACNTRVGNLVYDVKQRRVVGWLATKCTACLSEINWSNAEKYL